MSEIANEQRKRLKFLVEHFGQSEVARRTNTPPSTLSRYLRDTRLPAEFVARLVSSLEVRPAWFLLGEAPPFAAAISEKSAEMARNLLEIARAMSATSRMRAGAVFGQSDLRKLNDLNSALQELKKLRTDTREQFGDQFLALVESAKLALNRHDMDGAERLLKSAEIFAELCPDEEIVGHLRSCQAYFLGRTGNPEQALEPHSRLLYWAASRWGVADEKTSSTVINHITLLNRLDRRPEALSICEAFLALSRRLPRGHAARIALEAYQAFLHLSLGNMEQWLGRFLSTVSELRGTELFDTFASRHVVVLYMMGMGSMRHILNVIPDARGRVLRALTAVISMEDAEGLAQTLEIGIGEGPNQMAPNAAFPRVARSLLRRLQGGSAEKFRKEVLEDPKLLSEIQAHVSALQTQVFLAAFQRLAGMKKESLKSVRKFSRLLEENATNLVPDVLMEAQHLRNLLLVTDKQDAADCQAARTRLSELRRRGFRCLEQWADCEVFAT